MDSTTEYLVVSLPQSVNAHPFLERTLNGGKQPLFPVSLPDFQIKTLDSLVQLSEELAKLDTTLQASVAKVVDVIQTVEPRKLFGETRVVNSKPASAFVEHFTWNTTKYRLDKSIKDLALLISGDALGQRCPAGVPAVPDCQVQLHGRRPQEERRLVHQVLA